MDLKFSTIQRDKKNFTLVRVGGAEETARGLERWFLDRSVARKSPFFPDPFHNGLVIRASTAVLVDADQMVKVREVIPFSAIFQAGIFDDSNGQGHVSFTLCQDPNQLVQLSSLNLERLSVADADRISRSLAYCFAKMVVGANSQSLVLAQDSSLDDFAIVPNPQGADVIISDATRAELRFIGRCRTARKDDAVASNRGSLPSFIGPLVPTKIPEIMELFDTMLST